jgi:hypothetical protein
MNLGGAEPSPGWPAYEVLRIPSGPWMPPLLAVRLAEVGIAGVSVMSIKRCRRRPCLVVLASATWLRSEHVALPDESALT